MLKKNKQSKDIKKITKNQIVNYLRKKIKNLPSEKYLKIDLFENSYLDSLKFIMLLNNVEKQFQINIEFDKKTNLWIRTVDSLSDKILFLLKKR